MIIATAGHVDHGKTLLVKALTGVDADRLPEEKQRGMTIDLGFAYLPVEGARTIGFIDVPGHERFVRNMLCGVAGIGALYPPQSRFEAIAAPWAIAASFLNEMSGSSLP